MNGVRHWWLQRLTALVLAPLVIWFVLALALLGKADHAVLIAWIAQPLNTVLLIMTTLLLFWHSALGVQVIIEDYIAARRLCSGLILLVQGLSLLLAGVSVFAILKIACGTSL